jgi:glycosyltransferase involved in cell wall biosynthesis
VVIPTHNDAVCLELTLKSLRRQSLPVDLFEVIVVRDGGDADSYANVADAGKGLNLRIVELAEQRGRAGARNVGVEQASADLLLFLDADSYATPDLLRRHLDHHRDPGAAPVLVGRRDEAGLEHIHAALADEAFMPVPRHRADGGGDLRFGAQEIADDDRWLRAGWVFCFTHNVSVPRSLVDAVGGFNETLGLRWGLEDQELFYRVHAHLGVLERNFAYDDLAAVYHLPHYRNLSRNWADFWSNLKTVTAWHPVVDWEYIGPLDLARSVDRIVRYRTAIDDCVRRCACRIAPAAARLAPGLPGPRVLWVGTGSAQAQLPAEALTFDYAAPLGPTNFHLIGASPPIEPGSLDAVVSVDFWRYLYWPDLCQFVNKAGTLAGEVHLVTTGEELSAALHPDPATLEYFARIMEPGFQTSITEVDGLGVVLRLVPRQQPADRAA